MKKFTTSILLLIFALSSISVYPKNSISTFSSNQLKIKQTQALIDSRNRTATKNTALSGSKNNSPAAPRKNMRVAVKKNSAGSVHSGIVGLTKTIKGLRAKGFSKATKNHSRADAVKSLANQNKDPKKFQIVLDAKRKTVRAILGKFPPSAQRQSYKNSVAMARAFVNANSALFGIEIPEHQSSLKSKFSDESGTEHIRFQVMHNEVPVLNEDISVHIEGDYIYYVNGSYGTPTDAMSNVASISSSDALDLALKDLGVDSSQLRAEPDVSLFFAEINDSYKLVYQAKLLLKNLVPWELLIDAQTGEVLDRFKNVQSQLVNASGLDLAGSRRSFTAWREGDLYYMIDPSTPTQDSVYDPVNSGYNSSGDHIIGDANNNENIDELYWVTSPSASSAWDAAAVSVYANTRQVYDYYKVTHGRNSIDNFGQNLFSVIHYRYDYANAYWLNGIMVFGDGDQSVFSNLGGCLDVVAHEMTHGVIEYTAGLVYRNQSGALNESFADIFGAMVDRDDWLSGEDCVISHPYYLRSMSNPASSYSWQPDHMSKYRTLPDTQAGDWGGVHTNSGIPNRAAYLLAEGLEEEGLGDSIGRPKTERIFYRTLTIYLNSNSGFADARLGSLQAADDLYGVDSNEYRSVQLAWDTVGVTAGGIAAPTGGEDVVNTAGEDYVVYLYPEDGAYNNPNNEELSLYAQNIKKPYATSYDPDLDFGPLNGPIAPLETRAAPFAIDSGSPVFYIGKDNDIYSAESDGEATQMTTDGIYSSIAISHNGKKVALTSTDKYDKNIYILDVDAGEIYSYPIESPKYVNYDGVFSTALYADSLSFNYAGTKVLYDYFSCIPSIGENCDPYSASGNWSIASLDIGTGRFEFPFPGQPSHIDVGFPSYSKNSDRYFVFDLIDWSYLEDNQQADSLVILYDSLNRELEVVGIPDIGDNVTYAWGVPSFGPDDDFVVFQARDDNYSYGYMTHLVDYKWDQGDTTIFNDYDVTYPIVHRAADRDIASSLLSTVTSLNFGDVIAQSAYNKSFELSNNGDRTITITNVSVTGEYFTHNATNLDILPGQTLEVSVEFTAGRFDGSIKDVLSIVHNGDNDTVLINLEAFVVDADVSLESNDTNGNGRVDWNEEIIVDGTSVVSDDMRLLRLYIGALGRAPDIGGFEYWRERVASGTSFSLMGDEFFWSNEMQIQMDGNGDNSVSDSELITHLYVNVLQRTPDQEGFDYWVGRLQTGDGAGLVMASFLNGQEYVDATLIGIADFVVENPSIWQEEL